MTENDNAKAPLQDALDQMDEGFTLWDEGFCLVAWNKAVLKLLNWPEVLARKGIHISEMLASNAAQGDYGEGNRDKLVKQRLSILAERQRRTYLKQRPGVGDIEMNHFPLNNGSMVITYRDVTERRQAKATEFRLGLIVEQSLSEVYIFDANTFSFIQVNYGARTNLGYTMEELRTLTPLSIKPDHTLASFEDLIKPLINQSQDKIVFETIHERKNGSTYDVEVHLQLMAEEDSPVFLANIQDITERKKKEQELKDAHLALEKSETFLNRSAELAKLGYGIWDDTLDRDTIVSEELASIHGFSKEEYLATVTSLKKYLELVHPDDRDEYLNYETMEGYEAAGVDYRIMRPDGEIRHLHQSSEYISAPSGPPTESMVVIQDITIQKKAQSAHLENETLLSQCIEIARLGYAIWDDTLDRDTTVSEELASIHGLSTEEYLATVTSLDNYLELVHPDDRDDYRNFESMYRYLGDNDKHTGLEYRIIRPDREIRYLHERSRYIPVSSGQPTQSVVVIQDITERKQQELKLKEVEQAAVDANKAKSKFLATMSHEIRTPLNGLLGMSRLLQNSALNEDQTEQLDVIIDSGEILLELLNDVLDISRIEENQVELEHTHLDLESVFQKCYQLWSQRFEEENIEFVLENNLKDLSNLEGDPTRFYQILQNLLGNALKFTEAGKIVVTTRKEQETETDVLIRVEVQDSGVGISKEGQVALFDRFSQVDTSTTRKYGGSGLGLAICRELVTLMGGNIGVESEIGRGSTFWFTVRLDKGDPALSEQANKRTKDQSFTQVQFDPASKVLVAEDNKANQMVVAAFLKLAGLKADFADNGLIAVNMARKTTYDLVLMDIQMPELDGLAAAAQIRALSDDYKTTPIIAVTAHASSDSRSHFIELGMTDYIPKPIDPGYLLKVVAKYLPRISDNAGVGSGDDTPEKTLDETAKTGS